MLGHLIELPLRVAGMATRIGFGIAESALRRGAELLDALASDDDWLAGPEGDERPPARTVETDRSAPDSERPAAHAVLSDPPVAAPAPAPPVEEPVSEEPVLARSTADPGAEDGAGPELEVEQPWPDYKRMKVSEIADRVAGADAATLAVVTLYERQNADRKGVREAVEQRLEELERRRVASA